MEAAQKTERMTDIRDSVDKTIFVGSMRHIKEEKTSSCYLQIG